jgi:NadR type nicotinamide-nucleotide adenylyltransferase
LIDTATAECNRLYVAVCYSSLETIPVKKRIEWLQERHPSVDFFPVKDDSPVNYTDETWGLFLDALMKGLLPATYNVSGFYYGPLPDVIYSGEAYAPEFGERLLARYAELETRNMEYPVPTNIDVRILDRSQMGGMSATAFRQSPPSYWEYLAPATKAGLCKRIVVCGAESTGTTTLAKDLATFYKTTVVPEYGRYFDWAVGKHHEWKPEDFRHIAREQKEWEDKLARESKRGLLICDTDEFATAMFHEVYLGQSAPDILDLAWETPADLYIITDHIGVDFEDDGTRFNSGRRPWMTKWFCEHLPDSAKIVTGTETARLLNAKTLIDQMPAWDIADPIEKRTGYEYEGLVQGLTG